MNAQCVSLSIWGRQSPWHTPLILRSYVGTRKDEGVHAGRPRAQDGVHEGRAAIERQGVYGGAGLHQKLHKFDLTSEGRVVERRPQELVALSHVSPARNRCIWAERSLLARHDFILGYTVCASVLSLNQIKKKQFSQEIPFKNKSTLSHAYRLIRHSPMLCQLGLHGTVLTQRWLDNNSDIHTRAESLSCGDANVEVCMFFWSAEINPKQNLVKMQHESAWEECFSLTRAEKWSRDWASSLFCNKDCS